GTVLNMAPNPQAESGTALTVYQLAKYRIDRVCKGFYEGNEIIVDHLILSTKELEGGKVGDQVCIRVRKSERVFNRWDYPEIRKESDDVKMFNIGGQVKSNNDPDCSCSDAQ
ncbi:MAG TPA: hypothetical protein VJ742_03185, partial [Nitrososphaera sp.]|nr:hypothetical protein [Nitrososphaera sp.]